jgi:two-component system chemotaxis response regulator CheY
MFLDWNMPTMSGEAVVEKIKEAKIYPNLQIIMATTEGGQEKVMQMLRMGVAGYLVKPFRREAVAKITNKLLERLNR